VKLAKSPGVPNSKIAVLRDLLYKALYNC